VESAAAPYPSLSGGHKGPVTVLVVDDEEPIRSALKRFLSQQSFEVFTAADGVEALEALARHKIACVLLDVRLPDASGVDLVPKVIELEPNAAVLMLTAVNDAASAALCMQRGAMDYLTKPVDLTDLLRAIQRALRRRDTMIESQQINHWLKEEVAIRTAELRMERANLERISVATLEALVNALEAKDPYLRGHSARVADLAATVAAELGLDEEEVELVRTAGRLHDIGKIGIREEILNKQGPLTDEEFEHVKHHTITGSQILAPLAHLKHIIDIVRSHHERWDGKGYPDGLTGEAIPLGARIIGAVEIYDALTTSRPYQEKMVPELAIERLRDLVGTVIDPKVHRALQAVVARREALIFLDDSRG
jgi:cyclic di-GMP phosphodiesterase